MIPFEGVAWGSMRKISYNISFTNLVAMRTKILPPRW